MCSALSQRYQEAKPALARALGKQKASAGKRRPQRWNPPVVSAALCLTQRWKQRWKRALDKQKASAAKLLPALPEHHPALEPALEKIAG